MKVSSYLSLVKFSHTVFALPFAIIGFFLAASLNAVGIDWRLFLAVVLCMVFARNAAMAFNRYADRKIDAANPRTAKVREIPNGTISANAALWFVVLNCALFVLTTFFINSLCFYLSPVALLVVLGYSYTKRFTALCHLILGLGLSLAPLGAYMAVLGRFDWLPFFFSLAVLFWVSGFDIIYALQDETFDREQELRSIPVVLGVKKALLLSNILHFLTAFFILYAAYYGDFGLFYMVGSVLFISLLVYQHLLVTPNDFSKINLAFFTTNGIASVLFAVFVLLDIYVSF